VAIKRVYVYRDEKIVEITAERERQRSRVFTVDKDEQVHRNSCFVMDDIREQNMIDNRRYLETNKPSLEELHANSLLDKE
jgi:hypothetical protein